MMWGYRHDLENLHIMGAPYLKFHFYFGFSWIFPKPSSYWGTPMTLEIHFLITGFNQLTYHWEVLTNWPLPKAALGADPGDGRHRQS